MCPVEKIEPGPKSYDLIPHPSYMYFNKIKGTSESSKTCKNTFERLDPQIKT